jgi:CRISPR-associated endonuclease/helicase Cas3
MSPTQPEENANSEMEFAAKPESFFSDNFTQLTTRPPYPWQKKLFLRFIAPPDEPWPEIVDLPTGAGKTSALYVWLLALAWSIHSRTHAVPRRLAWVVNRRVVVDQVTEEATDLLKRIDANSRLSELLASISSSRKALHVTTLRGQLSENGDWSRDPSTPAVVIGTVDMIGSRLLFRGYRAGPYYRPMHAGLLGIDTVIVNDEAHLSPALAALLKAIKDQSPARHVTGKSFRILLLSATPKSSGSLKPFEHDPAEDAAENQEFSKVFHAPKSLSLREVGNLNELEAAVWALATESPVARTAIFVEQPEKALKLAERLRKDKRPCALLTGTMRGFERDGLLKDPTFVRFLSRDRGTEPVWLVCTSAGEVGINFSCERMITGLTEADHILQRFGRLNRFGNPEPGEAHVVFRNPPDKEPRLQKTLAYLRRLEGNVACAKIWENRPPGDACAETPALARLETRLIEMWAQTTYRDKFLPPVDPWLRGKQDSEEPNTEVAWRSDVATLTEWEPGPDHLQKLFDYYPVQTHERLSEPASRVAKKLEEIQKRIESQTATRTKLIVLETDGTPSITNLSQLVERTTKDASFLHYKMLVLPDSLGSVTAGMFNTAEPGDPDEPLDVADAGQYPTRIRFLFQDGGFSRMPTRNPTTADPPHPASMNRSDLETFAAEFYKPAFVIADPENEERFLIYLGARSMEKRSTPVDVLLPDHQASVAAKAKELAGLLHLGALEDTYEKAGQIHDAGKARSVWQRAMGGSSEKPLAKTKLPVNLRLIDGYRHELGSVLDALSADHADDLLLHLVASHHAAARPYFEADQYDPEDLKRSATETIEIARRFARLQHKYGPWGLAYLEAVLKCADGMVSAAEGEPASA